MINEKESIVIKFAGDSGDGMQLIGSIFSDNSAVFGNDLATFPDYPSEIRAPRNTLAGVSGFQVHIGKRRIYTYGDFCDILVVMNPASLKSNIKWAKKGATIILDEDAFNDEACEKAGYTSNPLYDGSLNVYHVIKAPITSLTRKTLEKFQLTPKIADRSRNMFALGVIYYLLNRKLDLTIAYFEKKFGKDSVAIETNRLVLEAGYNFAENIEALDSKIHVPPAKLEKGKYRNITGNIATAWGLLAAAEKAGLSLFLGSYPITPASDILIELSRHKSLGVKVFQAEDEIAAITSAIGASFAGALGVTSTSGPGLSLKTEALGLAVMTELPLVVVDVQRAGPSTGMPTKAEQSDLYHALFGRTGEAPIPVIAASSPSNCFYYAFEAAKIAVEHMTPVILLTDGFLGNGSQLFRIPKMAEMPSIHPPFANPGIEYKPYKRDPKNGVRYWAIPGMDGMRHRIGGLEKEDVTGDVSTDPINHQRMVELRKNKVLKIAEHLPMQTVVGNEKAELLIVSWGSTGGVILSTVEELLQEGYSIAHAHFHYLFPLPSNTAELLGRYKKVLVCELNSGQFANYLRMCFPQYLFNQYNKIQGLPFTQIEIKEAILNHL
ncbi:MAG: 2-oxoacid:acceptor oxidoreductase subunit alpha [Bacteroidales bacterium]|nr:2-oxoacid:acceptor oxidoreductase subunit alpha [Bacteroidales bacterium]